MLSKSIVILSLVFIIVHLVFCFLEKNRERKITKCFCVVSIGLIVWALGAKNIFVYFALLFGLLGDLCLIFKDNKKLLVLGMIAFGINHIFYYIGALQKIDNLNSCFYYIIPLVVIIISSIIYLIGKKYFKGLSIPSSLCFLPLLGNLIFIVSDLYLAKTLFIRHDKREDFYIMFTYLVGQFLLSLSIGLFY